MTQEQVAESLGAHRDELHSLGVASLSLFGSTVRIALVAFIRLKQRLEEILDVKKVDLLIPGGLYEEIQQGVFRETTRVA